MWNIQINIEVQRQKKTKLFFRVYGQYKVCGPAKYRAHAYSLPKGNLGSRIYKQEKYFAEFSSFPEETYLY